MEDTLKKIDKLDKTYKELVRIEIQSEEKLKNARTQYSEINNQLKEAGINSREDLQKMQQSLQEKIQELENLFPTEAIESYKKMEM